MTIEEIFSKISAHSIRGMMIHDGMANYYDFLGLHGFKRCHEYHYLHETLLNRKINRFFINKYNKLIPDSEVDSSSVIPAAWMRYTRQQVDNSTKRNAVESGFDAWVKWERDTCEFYSNMCIEFENMGEIAAAELLRDLILDNNREIKKAERMQLKFKATDYDMTYIVECQDRLHEKYKDKTEKIKL